jgi:hypothetical protein
VAVYLALGTARLQAGMPAPHAVPYALREAHAKGTRPEQTADALALLRCLAQLEAGAHGEPMTIEEAQELLVATVRAKVAEHAKRDDDFATGKHATIGTLVVRSNFAKWLAAGRAWLASGGRPAPERRRSNGVTPSSFPRKATTV